MTELQVTNKLDEHFNDVVYNKPDNTVYFENLLNVVNWSRRELRRRWPEYSGHPFLERIYSKLEVLHSNFVKDNERWKYNEYIAKVTTHIWTFIMVNMPKDKKFKHTSLNKLWTEVCIFVEEYCDRDLSTDVSTGRKLYLLTLSKVSNSPQYLGDFIQSLKIKGVGSPRYNTLALDEFEPTLTNEIRNMKKSVLNRLFNIEIFHDTIKLLPAYDIMANYQSMSYFSMAMKLDSEISNSIKTVTGMVDELEEVINNLSERHEVIKDEMRRRILEEIKNTNLFKQILVLK